MRFLVPTDSSAAAHAALRHALHIARGRPGCDILLLNVQNRDTLGLSAISAEVENERALAEDESAGILHAAATECRKAGVACESHAAFGAIAETITRVARESGADQIIMGTRGLSALGGLVLGSTAIGVIHLAHVPVTLVKKSARSESGGKAAHSSDGANPVRPQAG